MNAKDQPSILVAGAINTDLVAEVERAPRGGETLNGTSFAIHGGGKAANQAVAVTRSGGRAHLVAGVGEDDFGTARLHDLDRDGVDTQWVARIPDVPSGVALITVEQDGENRIVCVPGATDAVPADHATGACAAISPAWILATNELVPDALDALFRTGRAAGARIAWNVAPVSRARRSLLPLVDLVIVNRGEAAALVGVDEFDDPREAATALHREGVGTVVLTLGAEGACVSASDEWLHVQPPEVEAVDSTGAGDTFCGALMARLSAGESLEAALNYAVHASALSVTRAGAQSSVPTRDEVIARWPALEGTGGTRTR